MYSTIFRNLPIGPCLDPSLCIYRLAFLGTKYLGKLLAVTNITKNGTGMQEGVVKLGTKANVLGCYKFCDVYVSCKMVRRST